MAYTRGTKLLPINTIVSQIFGPCSVDTMLLLTLAFEQVARCIISIEEPDPKELYHMIQGESVYKSFKQTINDAGEIEGKWSTNLKRWAFSFVDIVDITVYKIFIIDVWKEGIINAASEIQTYEDCAHAPPGNYVSANRPFGGVLSTGGWFPAFAWVEHAPDSGKTVAPLVFIPPDGTGDMGLTFSPYPLIGVLLPYTGRIIDQGTGYIHDKFDINSAADPNRMAGIFYKSQCPPTGYTQALLCELSMPKIGVNEMTASSGSFWSYVNHGPNVAHDISMEEALDRVAKDPTFPVVGTPPMRDPEGCMARLCDPRQRALLRHRK